MHDGGERKREKDLLSARIWTREESGGDETEEDGRDEAERKGGRNGEGKNGETRTKGASPG